MTDQGGRYRLTTYRPDDGAVVGRHRVQVDASDPDPPLPGKFAGPELVDVESRGNGVDLKLE